MEVLVHDGDEAALRERGKEFSPTLKKAALIEMLEPLLLNDEEEAAAAAKAEVAPSEKAVGSNMNFGEIFRGLADQTQAQVTQNRQFQRSIELDAEVAPSENFGEIFRALAVQAQAQAVQAQAQAVQAQENNEQAGKLQRTIEDSPRFEGDGEPLQCLIVQHLHHWS